MPSAVEKRSYGSVEVFWLNSAEVVRRLREAAGRLLAEHPDVVSVHLFGSLAEGRGVPGSDADILIVLARSDERWIDRPLRFMPYFEAVGLPVDVLCYTLDEARTTPLAGRARLRGLTLARRAETTVS
ncbi:MAG: nucleotidyltransferase domain-containing protein [Armatimonadota bacterium]|nr:nucleotidyltransferase domain-containing protein [Armatimonadota bacterium]